MTSALRPEIQGLQRQLTLAGGTVINYDLQFSDRKTLEIAVHPDGSVVIKAPLVAAPGDIEAKIRKRSRWITVTLFLPV